MKPRNKDIVPMLARKHMLRAPKLYGVLRKLNSVNIITSKFFAVEGH